MTDLTYGQVGYLDQHMEQKLQETWARLLKMSGTADHSPRPAPNGITTPSANEDMEQVKPFAEHKENGTAEDDNTTTKTKENTTTTTSDATVAAAPSITSTAAEEAARTFRRSLWSSVKAEHPDSIVLRFLRARKWDVDKSLDMLVSSIHWRAEEDIERTVVARGEAVALLPERTKDDEGVLLQYRSGKSYVRATDKEGRPVYIVKPRLHDPHKQTSKAMEMFILHTIESIRLLVKAPKDRACLIFDMTGFGLRNMDFHAAKYIVDVFEARYPETLGIVLIHNAPFVFSGIWRIIKGWLDPVIASKINFTKGNKDLKKFITEENLQKEFGGTDTWEYSYIEPIAGENAGLEDIEALNKQKAEREVVIEEFERVTAEWAALSPDEEEAKVKNARRTELAEKLRVNYWKLDPHVRTRNIYDRWGCFDKEGNVDFKAAGSAKTNGVAK